MKPKIVRVPKPEPSAFNKNKALSPAIRERVLYYRGMESTLQTDQQTGIDIGSIKTEGDADSYIQAVTTRFLPTESPAAPPASKSVLVVGVISGFLTFVFFASLVLMSVLGRPVPPDSRSLVVLVLAIGIALSAGFLGGRASASGRLPLPWGLDSVSFSITGGIAVFVIVFLIGYIGYARTGEDSVILTGTVLDADNGLGISGATIIIKTDANIYHRPVADAGDFRVSDIPHLFNKQVTVSAEAENYKQSMEQTALITSYSQQFKFRMHNCYNGVWHEVTYPAGMVGLKWHFKAEGATLHIYRMDGFVSGDFHHGADGNWTGETLFGKPPQGYRGGA